MLSMGTNVNPPIAPPRDQQRVLPKVARCLPLENTEETSMDTICHSREHSIILQAGTRAL